MNIPKPPQMLARAHLKTLVTAVQEGGRAHIERVAHDAANFLQVPEMEPKEFQQRFCQQMRMSAQTLAFPPSGIKRQRFYIENIRGACTALEVLGSDQLNGLMFVFVMVCTRGASVVDDIADGKPVS